MLHIQTRPGMEATDRPEASQLPLSLLPARLVQLLFGTRSQSSGGPATAPKAPHLADGEAGWEPFSKGCGPAKNAQVRKVYLLNPDPCSG